MSPSLLDVFISINQDKLEAKTITFFLSCFTMILHLKRRAHTDFSVCRMYILIFFFFHPNFRMTCGKLYRDKSTLLLAEFGFKNLCKLPTKFNTQTANKNTSIFWKDFLDFFKFHTHIHVEYKFVWQSLETHCALVNRIPATICHD